MQLRLCNWARSQVANYVSIVDIPRSDRPHCESQSMVIPTHLPMEAMLLTATDASMDRPSY